MCTGAIIESGVAIASGGLKLSGTDIQKQFRSLVPSGSAPSIPTPPVIGATDELAKKRDIARKIRERGSAGPGRQSTILSQGQSAVLSGGAGLRTTLGGR